jgi:hypothetical protein
MERNFNILPLNYIIYLNKDYDYSITPYNKPISNSNLNISDYRIFKDMNQKQILFNLYGNTDNNITNIFLEDYKNEKIEPIIKKSINPIPKKIFKDENQIVRKLSIINYRLLNFILYSHLFYSNCLGYITEKNMNKYIFYKTDENDKSETMTCIERMLLDWNILKEELKLKGIQIQIFMNLIFTNISKKLKQFNEFKENKDREIFEESIENILKESFDLYKLYYELYNKKILQINKDNIKDLLLENHEIKEYDEKNNL